MPRQGKIAFSSGQEYNKEKEFIFLLEEYRKLNSQQTQVWLEYDQKELEMLFIAVSAVVIAATFTIQQGAYSFLLILTLPFHALIWAQARKIFLVRQLSYYIRQYLMIKISKHTGSKVSESDKLDSDTFISWEGYISEITQGIRVGSYILKLNQLGRVILPFSLTLALVFLYYILRLNNPLYAYSSYDTTLLMMQVPISLASLFTIALSHLGSSDWAIKQKSI